MGENGQGQRPKRTKPLSDRSLVHLLARDGAAKSKRVAKTRYFKWTADQHKLNQVRWKKAKQPLAIKNLGIFGV